VTREKEIFVDYGKEYNALERALNPIPSKETIEREKKGYEAKERLLKKLQSEPEWKDVYYANSLPESAIEKQNRRKFTGIIRQSSESRAAEKAREKARKKKKPAKSGETAEEPKKHKTSKKSTKEAVPSFTPLDFPLTVEEEGATLPEIPNPQKEEEEENIGSESERSESESEVRLNPMSESEGESESEGTKQSTQEGSESASE
jgi:hypothetical protein